MDIQVDKGDVIAILGPSGSGKTTLLRCINYLEKSDSGTIKFHKEEFELESISEKNIARLLEKSLCIPKLQFVSQ